MNLLRTFCCGMLMGLADLVPGVSGGTIAWIAGIYPLLLEAIRSFDTSFFKACYRFRLYEIKQSVPWGFCLSLAAGIMTSVWIFSATIHQILQVPDQQALLYAVFCGLTLGSVYFCGRQVRVWKGNQLIALVIGVMLPLIGGQLFFEVSPPSTVYVINPWIIFCGVIGVCALLLPGISGAYLLSILGVYPIVIASLASFTRGGDLEAFFLLANLGVGMLIGAFAFSRVVGWCLQKYPQIVMCLMIGFILGTVRILWPASFGWQTAVCMVLGFVVIFVMEQTAQSEERGRLRGR